MYDEYQGYSPFSFCMFYTLHTSLRAKRSQTAEWSPSSSTSSWSLHQSNVTDERVRTKRLSRIQTSPTSPFIKVTHNNVLDLPSTLFIYTHNTALPAHHTRKRDEFPSPCHSPHHSLCQQPLFRPQNLTTATPNLNYNNILYISHPTTTTCDSLTQSNVDPGNALSSDLDGRASASAFISSSSSCPWYSTHFGCPLSGSSHGL